MSLKKTNLILVISGIAIIGIIISYFPFHVLATGFARYGYWLLFVGVFLEGEAMLLAAGVCAYLGYLDIFLVIPIACLAIIAGDNAQYWLGRKLGKAFLNKYSVFQKINGKFNHHSNKIILFSRFLFGMRVATILMAGANNFNYKKFLKFNAISGILWVIAIAFLGFVFGASFVLLRKILKYSALAITVLVILGIVIYYFITKKTKKKII
ncbi:MAG: DedA family protein [bacterium]